MYAEVAAGETALAAFFGLVGVVGVALVSVWQGRKTRRQGTEEHFMARDMLHQLDGKVDRLDSNVVRIDGKVDRIDTKVDRLDERVDDLEIADRRREASRLGEGA